MCEADGCANQWEMMEACECADGKHGAGLVVKDSNGAVLSDGDDVVLIDHHDLNPGQREESVFVVRDSSTKLIEAVNEFIAQTRFPL